jgi:hypothetical protein
MKTKLAAGILIEVVLLLTASLAQQSSSVADPEAERILDKAAQAEGGGNVLGTLRTLRLTGSMYSGSSHLLGDVESIIKFPDKFRDTFTGADGKSLEYGFDGTEAWKRLTGGENSSGLPRLQLLLPATQWRLRYAGARFVGQRRIGNRQAYVVRALVRGQTSPADYYYDPVNYLLLQVDTTSETLPITYRVSRFQDIEGLKVPREWSFGENRTAIASIKLNIDIDDKQFAKPK